MNPNPTTSIFVDYPDIVSIDQLMEMLNIGRKAAYDLLKSGQIPSLRIGHKYRIPKLYVKSFVLGIK